MIDHKLFFFFKVIAYYFRANTSPPFWFEKCVRSILDDVGSCGFKVITTVCDMGNFIDLLFSLLYFLCSVLANF